MFEQIKRCGYREITDNVPPDAREEDAYGKKIYTHSVLFPNNDRYSDHFETALFHKSGRKWLPRKLFQDNWIDFKKSDTIAGEVTDFRIVINPIFNFQFGKSNDTVASSKTYTNSRGVLAKVELGKKLKFETAFVENQSVFISYLSADVASTRDVLGQGRWKKFKSNGYDYAMASGVLWWKPCRFFEMYAGHGKQKIGYGYRSFILSDQVFNFPYARFDFNIDRIRLKYTTTYAMLTNLYPTVNTTPYTPFGTEVLLQRKPFSWQYVSWMPHRILSLGFFQGMVWEPSDERNKLHIDPNYFNPLVGVNPGIYGFQTYRKILLGIDLQVKITPDFHLYAQAVTDGKKTVLSNQTGGGLQLGFKYYNSFGAKNLFLQGELNMYRNALYGMNVTTGLSTITVYNHYSRFLSLPVYMSDGNELVGIAAYRYKRVMIQAKGNFLMYYAKFREMNYLTSMDARISCIINSRMNMNISAGVQGRNLNTVKHKNPFAKGAFNELLYISFRTSLYNIYTDI
jgi:hypothetical protein